MVRPAGALAGHGWINLRPQYRRPPPAEGREGRPARRPSTMAPRRRCRLRCLSELGAFLAADTARIEASPAYMVVGVVLPQVDLSIILPAAGKVGEEEMSRLTEVAAA